jgi:chromate transporter
MALASSRPAPRLWELFVTWLNIGIQSFGGGSPTLYLIHQASITRGWLTEGEFAKAWAIVQISPGINLIKLAVLIGYELRGWAGLLMTLAGLLLPSATITVLMTAGFTAIRDWSFVKAAMRGVIPATIGLSLGVGLQMAQSLLGFARREGRANFTSHVFLLVGAALLLAAGHVSPVAVLALSGAAAMLLLGSLRVVLRGSRKKAER